MRKMFYKMAAVFMSATMFLSGTQITSYAQEVEITNEITEVTEPELEEEKSTDLEEDKDKPMSLEEDADKNGDDTKNVQPKDEADDTDKNSDDSKKDEADESENAISEDETKDDEIEVTLLDMPQEQATYISETYGDRVLDTYDITVPEGTDFPVQISFEASVAEDQDVLLYHFTGDEWEEIEPDTVEDGSITATFNSLSPVAVVDNTSTLTAASEKKIITVDGVDYDVTDAQSWDVSASQNGAIMAYYFTQNGNNYVLISGIGSIKDYGYNSYEGELSPLGDLPDYTVIWDDQGIYSIGNCFFYNYNYYPNDECKGIITSLPEGIHHIGYCAFSGSKFNANIPDSVEYIGWRAFENCQFLDITSLPESVTFIGSSAFGGCTSITRMALPVGITDIPERLFEECINLEYVTMSEDVESIGRYAFYDCEKLRLDRLPGRLQSVGDSAFAFCIALELSELPSSLMKIEKGAFESSGVAIRELPAGLLIWGTGVFVNCNNIAFIDFSNLEYIHEIPSGSFFKCLNLSSVLFSSNINSIGNAAFRNCIRLTDITAYGDALVGDKAFYIEPDYSKLGLEAADGNLPYSIPFWTDLEGDAAWFDTYDFYSDNRAFGSYKVTLPMSVELDFEDGSATGSIELAIENDTNGWDIQIQEDVTKQLTSPRGDVMTMSLEPTVSSHIYEKSVKSETVNIRAFGTNLRDAVYSGVITFTTDILAKGVA